MLFNKEMGRKLCKHKGYNKLENINRALTGKTARGTLCRLLWSIVKSDEDVIWLNTLFSRSSYSSVDILKIIEVVKNNDSELNEKI